MNKNINIPGRLHSVATDGQVAGANEIYDDEQQKFQGEINTELREEMEDAKEVVGSFDNRVKAIEDLAEISIEGGEVQVANTAEEIVAGSGKVPTANAVAPLKEDILLGAVYDVSAKNPTAGPNNDGKFESLFALLSDANLSTLIPTSVRKGGMSIKFVQSSDNSYVQYRLMDNQWSINVSDWQIIELRNFYAVCDTAAINGQKVITLNGFVRSVNNRLIIKMTYANTSTDAIYLKVNDDENINLFYNGALALRGNSWGDGDFIEVFFDGTQYQATKWETPLIKQHTGYAVCDVVAINGQKLVSIDGLSIDIYARFLVKMTHENTADDVYMNVNGTGNKDLYYNGNKANSENSWEAHEILDIFYDGDAFYAVPFSFKNDIVRPRKNRGTITSAWQSVDGSNTFNRNGNCITIGIDGLLKGINIGCGIGKYYGGYAYINNTNVEVYRYESYQSEGSWTTGTHKIGTYPHGLSFSDKTNIQIISTNSTMKANLIITTSNGGVFNETIDWFLAGKIQVIGTEEQDIIVTVNDILSTNIYKDIWLVGDSYLSYEDTARWTYWTMNYGFTNYLINNLPGAASTEMLSSFRNTLKVYSPKKAVWLVGMNDTSDEDNTTPNDTWLSNTQSFIQLCEEHNIEPILSTIPSVLLPKNHQGKSLWVRNSGYRYIDIADAVGASSDGSWYSGLQSTDGIHPTVAGAKVIASRVMVDLPEIML